jgi:Xaa-Pro aminopeptidase
MSTLVQQKVDQAVEILKEKGIDLWLTFVRETTASGDPVLPLIYGHDLTWQSALIITRKGERIAIVGAFEAETARMTQAYSTVIPYHESFSPALLEVLERINPSNIAINFSLNDSHADGLTHGMHQVLSNYLEGSPWIDRLTSAQEVTGALRGRKLPEEIRRLRSAIDSAEEIFRLTFESVRPGTSELQIGDFMHHQIAERGLEAAWEYEHCPTVNAGPTSPVGHVGPGETRLEPGNLLHIDFGVKRDAYCSDMQRVAYLQKPGASSVPPEVQQGFETVRRAIATAVEAMRPGVKGVEVDAAARRVVVDSGYPEYKYGTGHHVGQTVHDGAGILGPLWERYRETPNYRLEVGNVFTVEPGLALPGFGYLGLEEMVEVTENGARYLSTPQTELIVLS